MRLVDSMVSGDSTSASGEDTRDREWKTVARSAKVAERENTAISQNVHPPPVSRGGAQDGFETEPRQLHQIQVENSQLADLNSELATQLQLCHEREAYAQEKQARAEPRAEVASKGVSKNASKGSDSKLKEDMKSLKMHCRNKDKELQKNDQEIQRLLEDRVNCSPCAQASVSWWLVGNPERSST